LKEWCNWQRLKQEALQQGLEPLIKAIEQHHIDPSDIEKAFEAGYCQWWSQAIMTNNAILREFSSAQHMDKIERFRKLDDEFQKLTLAYIAASLSSGIPQREEATLPTDWKLVQREIQKQRQHKAVRQLICEANEAVKKLAPCMMMSPLSIAQYLPVSQDAFDVVIFDEASQITVWDAIGALSRGKQVIVAGDPKQMPPSNFFGRSVEYNEEEAGIDEDLESILDELIGSGVSTLRLNWHYRSRCESLIAFSNNKYYDGTLVTFPAVSTEQKSVSLKMIQGGCYTPGARTNEKEAKELVAECVRRLMHPNPSIRKKSIGIVTFNSDQQKLIEDLLDEERNKYPELETAFNSDNPDALFVKNLETVQGDERDVIFFSVTYGPDISGKISMNFGPLNRSGGERRLNVAFTRAKYEMVIFSSLQADQIDLNRTKAQGVSDLKHFLQYAKQGKSALGSFVYRSLGGYDSPFEQEVANALRQKGWTVHTQIGASSYRIDLAIVHPDKQGAYLAGIECDGATYHRSATARDRDKLRQVVLEGLGWDILRVWSTDWWTNKNGSIEELHSAITDRKSTRLNSSH
jgi:very-short-patch-repair endonuclease